MTGIYEVVTKTVRSKRLVCTVCDWCQEDIEEPGPYRERAFDLEFTEGSSCPDGGSEEGWEVQDLCDLCVERLRVLLIDQGICVLPVKRDW